VFLAGFPPVWHFSISFLLLNNRFLKQDDQCLHNNNCGSWWLGETLQLGDIIFLQLADGSDGEVVDWHDSAKFKLAIFLDDISLLLFVLGNSLFSLYELGLLSYFCLFGVDDDNLLSRLSLCNLKLRQQLLQVFLKNTNLFLRVSQLVDSFCVFVNDGVDFDSFDSEELFECLDQDEIGGWGYIIMPLLLSQILH